MRFRSVALAVAVSGLAAASPAMAQEDASAPAAEQAASEPLTAEKIIEVAQERLRPPGVWRPCKLPENENEIVVCARNPDANRVESPTDRAIAEGQPGRDSIPRAPNVDGPGIFQGKGIPIGKDPEPPLIVDLTNVPEGLSADEAKLVYRVEDGPPREIPTEPAAPQP